MQQPSWMLELLANETRIHHAASDGDRLAAMEQPTAHSYRAFLCRVYCFEAPLEAAFAATPGFNSGLLHTHMKAKRLAADLDALGIAASELDTAPLRFDDVADAMGWMYVVQRNTLLHGLLLRHFTSRIPAVVANASSYLAAHETAAGARLRELGIVLDHTARRTYIASRIVHAACEAFRCQRQWYASDAGRQRRARPITLQSIRAA